MVLAFENFRTAEGVEAVRRLQRERAKDPALADAVAAADARWVECRFRADRFNLVRNRAAAAVGARKKAGAGDGSLRAALC